MIFHPSSDIASVSTVVVPELSDLIACPQKAEDALNSAFSQAIPSDYRHIFNMKQLLYWLFGDDIPKCPDAEDFLCAYEKLAVILTESEASDISTVFPGFLSLPFDMTANENFRELSDRLSSFCKSVTISTLNKTDRDFLLSAINIEDFNLPELSLITDRKTISDAASILSTMVDRGCTVTVCSNNTKNTYLSALDLPCDYNICVSGGHILIPGMTVLRLAKPIFDLPIDYSEIKAAIAEIADEYVGSLYARSSRGKLYPKPNHGPALPDYWDLFYPYYPKSKNKHKLYFTSSCDAVCEYICISLSLPDRISDTSDETEKLLRYSATACKYLEARYPFRFITHFKDKKSISSTSELIDTIRTHTATVKGLLGNYSLSVDLTDDFILPSPQEICSLLKVFFSLGGIMITFQKGTKQ